VTPSLTLAIDAESGKLKRETESMSACSVPENSDYDAPDHIKLAAALMAGKTRYGQRRRTPKGWERRPTNCKPTINSATALKT
jgi:hypothetical protein